MTMPDRNGDARALPYADALALLEVLPDGLIVTDDRLRCRFANAALAALLEHGREELPGRSVLELLGEKASSPFGAQLECAASERREVTINWTGPRAQAMTIHVMPRARWIALLFRRTGSGGTPSLPLRVETHLSHAQKLETMGRLAGGVAHDFNNLLTVIQNYSCFVSTELPSGSPALADMEEVLRATASAADLTRQLLTFSRRQDLDPREHDVKPIIMRVAGMLRRVIGEDIAIETELAPHACSIFADPGQVEQVLMNLAVNARDAMPNGGILRLRCDIPRTDGAAEDDRRGDASGTLVRIEVEDTGTGIAPERVQRIFEPFYTTKGQGTGLGLALVRGIVHRSGGHVHVDSALGNGTRFTVLLPHVGEREPEAADGVTTPAPATPPQGRAETILVVEDEARVRLVIHRMLQRLGYSVLEAGSADAALRIAATLPRPPALVLTDLVMPHRSGRALADELRERWSAIKVLFMSGYTDDDITRRGLLPEGTHFLEKPFTLESVAVAVRRALDEGTVG